MEKDKEEKLFFCLSETEFSSLIWDFGFCMRLEKRKGETRKYNRKDS